MNSMKNSFKMSNETFNYTQPCKTNLASDLDRIRGSLIGGAVGDALGYAIEFDRENTIFQTYGSNGITEYELTNGQAIISDDTQMTLFTANGLLVNDTKKVLNAMSGSNKKASTPRMDVQASYVDWYATQNCSFDKFQKRNQMEKAEQNAGAGSSWLLDVPELFARRAPGITCLSALQKVNSKVDDFIKKPVNNSKGCGGIMRVAPVALRYRPGKNYEGTLEMLDMEAAQIAAITHGHSLGYMTAAVFSHVLSGVLMNEDKKDGSRMKSLKEIVVEARDVAKVIFAGDPHLEKMVEIIDLAIELSENNEKDLDNIHKLGEGWVAEETLGIALYCSLKYSTDFTAAMIASVNHKGDSDSTGAVTGNIVGAIVGYEAIEESWKNDLELRDVILEMADDLCFGPPMNENGECSDSAWGSKYVDMRWDTRG